MSGQSEGDCDKGFLAREFIEGIVLPAEVLELRQGISAEGEIVTRVLIEFREEGLSAFQRMAKHNGPGRTVKLVIDQRV